MVVRVIILFVIISLFALTVGYFIDMLLTSEVKTEDYTRGNVMIITQEQLHFSMS